jgi:hypothetical protein
MALKKELPLVHYLKKHFNIKGIEQLQNMQFLKTAQIGKFGEIHWKDFVTSSNNEK